MTMLSLPPLTGGPGQYVPIIMSAAWAKAAELSGVVDARVDEALALASSAPSTAAPDAVLVPTLPASPALPGTTQAEASGLLDAARDDVTNLLVGKFTEFLTAYFPEDQYITDAQDWLHRAIAVGGTGISTAVESQLWERARARALADAARAQEELSQTFAARRFAVPPGAYLHASLQIARGAQDATAEAAREQAIKSFETEVGNTRLAIERAISLRGLAVQSAGQYIGTLAAGSQSAVAAASVVVESQNRLAATLTDYYRAQLVAIELPVRVATTNAELGVRTSEANLRAAVETLHRRVEAVLANAQMLGTQAAAAFNALHTQASVSGNDSTTTSIQG